jgi:NSS family neurotransmitter:Na+ symporter
MDRFKTRLGVVATTVGSAVGLGNIWRFPYEAGNSGGSAFIVCYLGFILLLGIPVLCAEFMLGKETRANIFGCFKKLSPGTQWRFVGVIGIIASLMILSFYSVVAGWTLHYLFQSLSGALNSVDRGQLHENFVQMATTPYITITWTCIFLLINYFITIRGVHRGIEKMASIMMPLLFVILLAFCVNSLTMSKAGDGLKFLFSWDIQSLTPRVVLSAMGQAFFSLSLGLGCMLTYGSYFKQDSNIVKNAAVTASLDSLVAIMAGIVIFPAVFSFGFSPEQGPALVFEIFPAIFNRMAGGVVWACLFFFMLFVASLTSTISMSEISIAYFCGERGMSRRKASTLCTAIALIFGTLCALSAGGFSDIHIGSFTLKFFDFFNDTSSNVLLPIGGLLVSIYVGWFLDRRVISRVRDTITPFYRAILTIVVFLLKFIVPIFITLVFLASLGVL